MDKRKDDLSDHQVRQAKADQKVAGQEAAVRRMNGSAKDHPEEQQLLNEIRHNKASIDLNRALFDYDQEEEQEGDKPGSTRA